MLRKYLSYLILFVLLSTIATLVFTKKSRTLHKGIYAIIPQEVRLVDKIVITQKDNQITLDKSENNWKVNGTADARKEVLELLISSMQRIEILSPASKAIRNKISADMRSVGRNVKLYKGGRVIGSFFICYNPFQIEGTYMMDEQSDIPVMVKLKGYTEKNIENLFSMNLNTWRENTLFGYDPVDIKEIVVEYTSEPEKSFKILRSDNGDLILSELRQSLSIDLVNMHELSDYLYFFGKVKYKYEGISLADNMNSERPFVRIIVKSFQGSETTLTAYRYYRSVKSSDAFDKNRFIALINHEKDTVLINYPDIDPILRQKDDFQKK
jgi:hypothetical protein